MRATSASVSPSAGPPGRHRATAAVTAAHDSSATASRPTSRIAAVHSTATRAHVPAMAPGSGGRWGDPRDEVLAGAGHDGAGRDRGDLQLRHAGGQRRAAAGSATVVGAVVGPPPAVADEHRVTDRHGVPGERPHHLPHEAPVRDVRAPPRTPRPAPPRPRGPGHRRGDPCTGSRTAPSPARGRARAPGCRPARSARPVVRSPRRGRSARRTRAGGSRAGAAGRPRSPRRPGRGRRAARATPRRVSGGRSIACVHAGNPGRADRGTGPPRTHLWTTPPLWTRGRRRSAQNWYCTALRPASHGRTCSAMTAWCTGSCAYRRKASTSGKSAISTVCGVAVGEAGVLGDVQRRHAPDVLAQPAQGLDGRPPPIRVGLRGPGEDHDMTNHGRHPSRPPERVTVRARLPAGSRDGPPRSLESGAWDGRCVSHCCPTGASRTAADRASTSGPCPAS